MGNNDLIGLASWSKPFLLYASPAEQLVRTKEPRRRKCVLWNSAEAEYDTTLLKGASVGGPLSRVWGCTLIKVSENAGTRCIGSDHSISRLPESPNGACRISFSQATSEAIARSRLWPHPPVIVATQL
jgi:hypothetical protein